MTRKIAALMAAAALGLSACASPEGPGTTGAADTSTATQNATQAPESATVEPAAAAPETTAPEIDRDQIAEMAYMSTVGGYTYPSREEAIRLGRMACSLLDQGTTASDLAMEVALADGPVVPGFRNDELPNFYGAAIGTFCQEHGWQVGLDFE